MASVPPRPSGSKIRIFLLGYGCLGLHLLKGLLHENDIEIVGVFRWSQRTHTDYQSNTHEEAFGKLIEDKGLHEIRCPNANGFEFTQILTELSPDYVLISTWGEILKPHLLNIPNIDFINCHPSKLPTHRGPNPYTSVILQNESETGISIHRMTEGVDEGNILLQQTFSLKDTMSGGDVRDQCGHTLEELVPELVELLNQETLPTGKAQDVSQSSYFPAINIECGRIQWHSSPEEIDRQVRGLQPWLNSYGFTPTWLEKETMVSISELTLHKPATVNESSAGTILNITKQHIEVASSNPEITFHITSYQLYARFFFLPPWLSQYIAPFLLRVGGSFSS